MLPKWNGFDPAAIDFREIRGIVQSECHDRRCKTVDSGDAEDVIWTEIKE